MTARSEVLKTVLIGLGFKYTPSSQMWCKADTDIRFHTPPGTQVVVPKSYVAKFRTLHLSSYSRVGFKEVIGAKLKNVIAKERRKQREYASRET